MLVSRNSLVFSSLPAPLLFQSLIGRFHAIVIMTVIARLDAETSLLKEEAESS